MAERRENDAKHGEQTGPRAVRQEARAQEARAHEGRAQAEEHRQHHREEPRESADADRDGNNVQSLKAATEASERASENVSRATRDAAEHARQTAERVGGTMQRQAAELSEGLSRAGEQMRDTAQATAEDMRALMAAQSAATHHLQEMQRMVLDLAQRQLARSMRMPQDLMRCTSLPQFAEYQRQLFSETMNDALAGGAQVLDIARRIAEDAARPLDQRVEEIRREGRTRV